MSTFLVWAAMALSPLAGGQTASCGACDACACCGCLYYPYNRAVTFSRYSSCPTVWNCTA